MDGGLTGTVMGSLTQSGHVDISPVNQASSLRAIYFMTLNNNNLKSSCLPLGNCCVFDKKCLEV